MHPSLRSVDGRDQETAVHARPLRYRRTRGRSTRRDRRETTGRAVDEPARVVCQTCRSVALGPWTRRAQRRLLLGRWRAGRAYQRGPGDPRGEDLGDESAQRPSQDAYALELERLDHSPGVVGELGDIEGRSVIR